MVNSVSFLLFISLTALLLYSVLYIIRHVYDTNEITDLCNIYVIAVDIHFY